MADQQSIEVNVFQAQLVINGVARTVTRAVAMQFPIYKETVHLCEYEDDEVPMPLGKVLGLTLDATKRLNQKGARPERIGYTDYDNYWFYLENTDDGLAWYRGSSSQIDREIELRNQIPALIL